MKKSTFVQLVAGVMGGLLFSVGMCMCLLPAWNAFSAGVLCTAAGAVILLILAIAAWVRSGKKIKINRKRAGTVLFGIFGVLVLGVGMSLVLVGNQIFPGIAVGTAGILLILMLIPMCLGLK